jgi:catechol 2,3-dioxygenase-like lactoylglutathione lyase family enzyme
VPLPDRNAAPGPWRDPTCDTSVQLAADPITPEPFAFEVFLELALITASTLLSSQFRSTFHGRRAGQLSVRMKGQGQVQGSRSGATMQPEETGGDREMSTVDGQDGETGGTVNSPAVDLKLEVVVIPVADPDRSKAFYADLGWRLDADFSFDNGFRVAQFTPPGSLCSVQLGAKITGASGRVGGPDPDHTSYSSFATFQDPDGNSWLLQQVTERFPGRIDPTTTSFNSAGDLAGALPRAETAHGEHEKRIGRADPDWPDWYAAYMVREQTGQKLPA